MYKPLDYKDRSKRRLLVSIVIGVVSMLLFYFFQQYLFVLFRSALLAFEFNVNHILSEDTGALVSYIFAGNAVIIGNSVGISFYVSGTSKNIKKRFRKRNVLNNQSFVIGSYFFWFFKIAVLMGSLPTILLIPGLFEYVLEIYALLFIVLFLESIKEVRRSFRGYSLRVLFLHFLLIIGVGLMLTCINKSNYYKLGIICNTSDPYVDIPIVNVDIPDNIHDYDVNNQPPILFYNRYKRVPVKVLSSLDNLIYTVHGDNLSIDELLNAPQNEKYSYSVRYGGIADLNLYANRDITYERFKELEESAIIKGMNKIHYVVYSKNENREYIYTKYLYPTKEMLEDSIYTLPESFRYFGTFLKDKKAQVIDVDDFKNNSKVDQQKVYEYFKESVSDSIFFNLKINKEVILQEYLDFMISYKQSVYDLRDEQRRKNKALNIYIESGVNEKYPFLIIEEIE